MASDPQSFGDWFKNGDLTQTHIRCWKNPLVLLSKSPILIDSTQVFVEKKTCLKQPILGHQKNTTFQAALAFSTAGSQAWDTRAPASPNMDLTTKKLAQDHQKPSTKMLKLVVSQNRGIISPNHGIFHGIFRVFYIVNLLFWVPPCMETPNCNISMKDLE